MERLRQAIKIIQPRRKGGVNERPKSTVGIEKDASGKEQVRRTGKRTRESKVAWGDKSGREIGELGTLVVHRL